MRGPGPRKGLRAGVALLAVVAAGAFLRFDGFDWDDGVLAHPDERFMSMVAASVHAGALAPAAPDAAAREAHRAECLARHPASGGVGDWFDTRCSDFVPANVGHGGYAYGLLPLAAVRLAAEALAAATDWPGHRQYGGIHRVGRALSAAADVLTLVVVFLLGRLLWGRVVGMLAAGLYAGAVLPIQSAHFFTVDSAATLFVTLAVLFAARLARFGERADAMACGAAAALAMACKISALPALGLLALAAACAPARAAFVRPPGILARAAVRLPDVVLGLVAAAVTFRIAAPNAFVGPAWHDFALAPAFLAQLDESRRLASGVIDFPPNWQWLDRPRWGFAAYNLLVWGLGPALGAAALAGVACRGVRLLRWTPVERARLVPWAWAVGYFAFMGGQWAAAMRYLLPVYPVLCLLAAATLAGAWRRARRADVRCAGRRWRRAAAAAVVVLVAGMTAAWAVAYHHIPRTLHPYVAATQWMLRNLPAPVAAPIATATGTSVLLNFPAHGTFAPAVPPRVASPAIAPATGTIDRLRLRVEGASADPVALTLRLLDADGTVVGRATATFAARRGHDVDVPLHAPLDVRGGARYQLQVDVHQGSVTLAGARIAHEGPWNDPLPTRSRWPPPADTLDLAGPSGTVARDAPGVDPFGEGHYVGIDLGMAAEDDEAKRTRLIEGLAGAEWLVVPNARFHATMPRNPLRFPLTARFYDALFGGDLGFDPALVVARRARLAGIAIDDQPDAFPALARGARFAGPAEEAFSVYDHPTVHVFRKRASFTRADVERALGGVELTSVDEALRAPKPATAGRLQWSTREADAAPDGLLLAAPTASATPGRAVLGASQLAAVAGWYAITVVAGWIAWPWLALLWPGLPDRGYAIARIAGPALLAFVAWWLAWLGVPAWSQHGLAALVAAGAAASAVAAWRLRFDVSRAWRGHGRDAVRFELAFLGLFAVGVLLRAVHPDLWAPVFGGEKPMDYAYFNSVLATTAFPPPDPWFAGGRLNYYYFGWVMAGAPAKLLGVPPAVAYNIALAMLFALTGAGAIALAWNACSGDGGLARRRTLAAGLAVVTMLALGNLDVPRAIRDNVDALADLAQRDGPVAAAEWRDAATRGSGRWYWAPSRTVGERAGSSHEVNEFPAFSFLYGDLHAHLMALPLQLYSLVALLALLLPAAGAAAHGGLRLAAQVLAVALGVALLRATNTWDWPLHAALGTAGTALAAWRATGDLGRQRPLHARHAARAGIAALAGIGFLVAQAALARPFDAAFVAGEVSLRLYEGARTPLAAWLAIHGWFVLVLAGWGVLRQRAPDPGMRYRLPTAVVDMLRAARWGGIAWTLATAVLASTGRGHAEAVGLQIALAAWSAELLARHAASRGRTVMLALACAGFALAAAVEVVVVGRDLGRMNTFFKLHLQSWICLSLASAIALADLASTGVPRRAGRAFGAVLAVASLVALAYVPLALYARAQTRFEPGAPPTLDGEAFLARATYATEGRTLRLADDARLVAWLRTHARPGEAVLEAQTAEYRWGSRVSSMTGLPTVLGYRFHQTQQRPVPALGNAIELRRRNVEAIYATADAAAALAALRDYRVRYVVIGGLERAVYPAAGLAKFAAMAARGEIDRAFAAGDDAIYRVPTPRPAPDGPRW